MSSTESSIDSISYEAAAKGSVSRVDVDVRVQDIRVNADRLRAALPAPAEPVAALRRSAYARLKYGMDISK
jgi:hypothetical protein